MEKEMATHSSVLAWRISGMGEPGRLPSLGSHRVGHDWSNLAAYLLTIASFYHHCLSSAFSKASKLSLFISMLESKDIEKPEPENKVFILCLYHPGWPPQEAERADSCMTLAVPSVCPREWEVSLAGALLHRPRHGQHPRWFLKMARLCHTSITQWPWWRGIQSSSFRERRGNLCFWDILPKISWIMFELRAT